jgi:methionine-S-sulfoxide reductase
VIRTRVGYAGGLDANPDYGNIGDHTETVQVDYDPERINYHELLQIFWQDHNPTGRSRPRQYMNAVFYHNDRQRDQAMASKIEVEKRIGRSVNTKVVPLRSFTMAEGYHQKYYLKQRVDLLQEMTRYYPLHSDLVFSTAVARLNGYVGGHGSREQLAREIDVLGLSDTGQRSLMEIVSRRWK